jgi:hypothetical protein
VVRTEEKAEAEITAQWGDNGCIEQLNYFEARGGMAVE